MQTRCVRAVVVVLGGGCTGGDEDEGDEGAHCDEDGIVVDAQDYYGDLGPVPKLGHL